MVMVRKLLATGEFDIRFKDVKKEYAFGVPVFANTQARRAGVLKLKFE